MKNNIKKFIKENANALGLLCLFIIIQPFLDIMPLFTNEKLQLFGFTIPTLVRCGFIAILGLISIKQLKKDKHIYIFIYFIILTIYTLIHHKIASSNMTIPDNYYYSLSSELFYIIRMILPLAIIQFTKNTNIDYNKFIKTIIISAGIVGTVIFIGNTFCISYRSYGIGTTVTNWIHWFSNDLSQYEFYELTSKGWFYMANQVSGIMILLLPFCIYDVIKKRSFLNIYATTILIISMTMIGTRTASYGWLALTICILIIAIYIKLFHKEKIINLKNIIAVLAIMLIGTIFLIESPIVKREYGYALGDITTLKNRPAITPDNLEDVYTYIEESYDVFKIQKTYITDLYNYKYDPKFWYVVFDISLENGVIENREMETLITKRIDAMNNHQLKYQLFGYSFTRFRNGEIYIEHDFIVHKYTIGYLGILLLICPYIAIILSVGIKILRKGISFLNLVFLASIGATLGVSIITGHLLDELFVTIYIGFVCGFFQKRIQEGVK